MGPKKPPAEDQPTTVAPIDPNSPAADFGFRDATVRTLIESALHHSRDELRFEEVVEDGGVGSISIAFEPALQRRVAAKSLKKESYADPLLVRGFLREAQIIAQLEHPNIIAVHRLADSEEKGVHFTMGLVEGRNLSEILATGPGPDYEQMIELLRILIRVCDALEFAHSRGVVHCDVKPANIMVGEFGRVYLMDWGGARLLEDGDRRDPRRVTDDLPTLADAEAADRVFGTPSYMPPEQARAEPLDQRADVFAIGAILYRFLAGHAPFEAESPSASLKLAQACDHPPLPETEYAGVLPHKLFSIAQRALAREPDQRYPGIGALKQDLVSILRGGGSFPTVTFQSGEAIIIEGEQGDAGYIIVSGRVAVFREVEGKRVDVGELGPGEVFGETAIFAAMPRTASVTALSKVVLVRIDQAAIQAELRAMKPWMASFVKMLAERFQESESLRLKGEQGQ